MVQSIGTTAASAQLSGTGTITGFSTMSSSGVILAVVFCESTETSPTAYAMSGPLGSPYNFNLVGAYINGDEQSIYLFAMPFTAALVNATFTLTPSGQNSEYFGFVLIEAMGSQNSTDPVGTPNWGTSTGTNIGGLPPAATTVSATSNAGQNVLYVTNQTSFVFYNTIVVNAGGPTQESVNIGGVGNGILYVTNLKYTHNAGEPVTMTGTQIIITNANDMILGLVMDEAGQTDVIVGANGYTTAISTTNFSANVGAACGVVYLVVNAIGTYNPTATDTNGGQWVVGAVAIKAAVAAPPPPPLTRPPLHSGWPAA